MIKVQIILGQGRPPPILNAGASSPKCASERKGTLLGDFKGEKQFGEISRLKEGEEVTEIEPDDGGWTLVRTSKGEKGKAPTNYIEWETKGDSYLALTSA